MNPTHFFRPGGFAALTFALTMLACAGCSSDSERPNTPAGTFRTFLEKLRTCGTLSSGIFASDYRPTFEQDCLMRCMLEHGACADVNAWACEESTSVTDACLDVCSQDVECADGGTIELNELCNGYEDCEFGEDEDGCEAYRFRCEDGSTIDMYEHCDGWDDCGFGEDEDGCAMATCADGRLIPQAFLCNGDNDCADGDDELGCASLTCGG